MSWIKVRTNLHEDPRVLHIAQALQLDIHHVVGMLVRLWGYADQHSVDGTLRLVQPLDIDRLAARIGFAAALQEVGWLTVEERGVTLPRYGEHNGQTAKDRAQNALRVARFKAREAGNGATVTDSGKSVTPSPLLEERRGEESREDKRSASRCAARAQARKKGGKSWM